MLEPSMKFFFRTVTTGLRVCFSSFLKQYMLTYMSNNSRTLYETLLFRLVTTGLFVWFSLFLNRYIGGWTKQSGLDDKSR